jgi:hydrogenase-4 component F
MLLLLLFLAIGGMPPFGAFWSKLLIFQATMSQGSLAIGALFLGLVAIAFLGMAGVLLPMLQGGPDPNRSPAREPRLALAAPLLALAGVLILGIYLPPALTATLKQAASLLGGGG